MCDSIRGQQTAWQLCFLHASLARHLVSQSTASCVAGGMPLAVSPRICVHGTSTMFCAGQRHWRFTTSVQPTVATGARDDDEEEEEEEELEDETSVPQGCSEGSWHGSEHVWKLQLSRRPHLAPQVGSRSVQAPRRHPASFGPPASISARLWLCLPHAHD